MKKKIRSNLYMESRFIKPGITVEYDPQGYLYSQGRYRTKILPEDLPEWYIHGYLYKRYGFISAKGVKHLFYDPNYTFENHLHKYDSLFISYKEKIEPYQSEEMRFKWYKGYDHALGGSLIKEFVEAAAKFSNYNADEILQEIARKRAWYYERNPN